METRQISGSMVNENDSSGAWRGGLSSDNKSLVILTVVLLMLIGSAGALTAMLDDGASFAAVANTFAGSPPAVPYVHSRYVNQAKEIEEQPATF